MKKIILVFLICIFILNFVSAAPLLFFSDLTSGPNTGGQNNNGVFVSIFGKNFGSSRGSSYVTVGGGVVDNYPVWGEKNAANPNLDMITFQLGANAQTGDIVVHTSEGDSNGLPFTVRPGRIFFVDDTSPNNPGSGTYEDPWRSPASFYTNMVAGDTCYIRAGTYNGLYGDVYYSTYQLAITSSSPNGAINNEIAWVGYPGETVRFEADEANLRRNIGLVNVRNYYVFANIQLYARGNTAYFAGVHSRWINNDCIGSISVSEYGDMQIGYADDVKIYGCSFHGANTGNKLDHIIYINRGSDNIDVGWNHLYDNNIQQGPWISVNNDGAKTDHWKFESILIHDNLIECSNNARAIGFGATDTGSTGKVYNNVILTPSSNSVGYYSLFQWSGSLDWYNNVIYNASGSGAVFGFYTGNQGADHYFPETVNCKNNILYVKSGESTQYFYIANENEMTALNIFYNSYYGNGNGPSRDVNSINSNPLFVNALNNDFHLQASSPAIDAGTSSVASIVLRDYDGNSRPQGNGFDIGAYEYVSSQQTYHAADTNQNGKIEMRELIAFIARWKNSEVTINDVMSALDRWLRGA